jgi:predicted nuclease of predicted toxin-antitoxin system
MYRVPYLSAMNFFLDENFPLTASELLVEAGHRSFRILDFEPQGMDDKTVFEHAQAFEAVLLSTDKDFFHSVPFLFKHHAGVVVIALRQPNRRAILDRLCWFLANMPTDMSNRVYMLRDKTYVVTQ